MTSPIGSRLTVAAAAAAVGWATSWSWAGLVEQKSQYIGPGFVAALLVVLVGTGVRALRGNWLVALIAQIVVLLAWFGHRQGTGGALGGWIPTPGSVETLIDQVRSGAEQVNDFGAPVAAMHAQAPVYLLAVTLLLLLGVDLIAVGLRRAPWVGLPVIVALTVPISVLDGGLPAPVFLVTGILFAVLLATAETDRLQAWDAADHDSVRVGRSSAGVVALTALGIGTATAVIALVLPIFVPVGAGILGDKDGSGGGNGAGGRVTLTNPLVDLKRDLVQNSHVPLVDAITDAANPAYLRLTVLDQFDGSGWRPSARDLGAANKADGTLPDPAGVRPGTPGRLSQWNLRTSREFATSWLPVPYSPRVITIDSGDWRYTRSTLDIASARSTPPLEVDYRLTAFTPTFDASTLADAPPPPGDIRSAMTQVPELDPEVTRIAKEKTATGSSDYEKAVLLQDWFRGGEFRYSLDQRPGSGMGQLLRFITDDKVGYCEQFAAAMAVMARALDIPARVVVGFLDPTPLGGDRYRYSTDDLHAWPELYFSGSGWVRFEPTPSARTGTPPPWTTARVDTPATEAPTALPSVARPTEEPTQAPVPQQTDQTTDNGASSTNAAVIVVLALAVVGITVVPALLRRSRRRRRLRPGPDGHERVAALWAELRATMIDLDLDWPQGRSVRETAAAVVTAFAGVSTEDRAALERLVRLVERTRYARDVAPSTDELTEARATVVAWSALLRRSVPTSRVRRAQVLPRSVFEREVHDESSDPTPVR